MSYVVRAVIRNEGQLLFTTDTHYPVITRGAGNNVELLVKRVAHSPEKPDASLTNTYWKLVSVAGKPYQHNSKNREPHLKLIAKGNAVKGFGGCNLFSGHFERSGSNLQFRPLATTMRACVEGMPVESRFLGVLGNVNRYAIQGDSLRLYNDDMFLLGFEAVYF
jgi:putative lipoprotein